MAAAHHRQHSQSTGATLALTLTVGLFGAGATGATLALFRGLAFGASPILTNVPLAVVIFAGGVFGVAYFLPVGVLLALS